MVSAYNTLSSARSMGAQAVSALQLLETMQSLELTPTGAPTIRRSVLARMAGNADPVAGRLRAPAGRKPPLPRVDPGIQAAAWQRKPVPPATAKQSHREFRSFPCGADLPDTAGARSARP